MKTKTPIFEFLLFLFFTQLTLAASPVAYSGKIAIDGKNHNGPAQFDFSIVNEKGVEVWVHSDDEDSTIEINLTNGRYLALLGGQGMKILPNDLFVSHQKIFLKVGVDLLDGEGMRSLLPDQPITASFHALSSDYSKVAEKVAPGSVTEEMLSQSLLDSINKPLEEGSIFKPTQLDPKFVRYFTPKIIENPESTSLIQGSKGSLSVGVEGQFLSYQWFKNGEPIAGATSASLVVENAKFDSDDANYSVVVTNDWGGVETSTVKVRVLTNPPLITLLEGEDFQQEATFSFQDPGATAEDALGNDLSAEILVEGADFNTSKLGSYKVLYAVTDAGGNTSTKERVVTVDDTLAPEFDFQGYEFHHHPLGVRWREPGVEAHDLLDGDLTDAVSITGTVDPSTLGEYQINYKVSDKSTNESVATRIVEVSDIAMIKNVQSSNPDGSASNILTGFQFYEQLDPEDYNGSFFFSADDGEHGTELWKSDGTEEGTYMLKNFTEKSSSADTSDPGSNFQIVKHYPNEWEDHELELDNTFYIFAENINQSGDRRFKLWISEGEAENTQLLGEFSSGSEHAGNSGNNHFTDSKYLYFSAKELSSTDTGTNEPIYLWRTDGTVEGTVKLVELTFSNGNFNLQALGRFDDIFCFADGGKLYRTDGSLGGTFIVKEFALGDTASFQQAIELHTWDYRWAIDGFALFSANDGVHGRELWITDGTKDGTSMLKNFSSPDQEGGSPGGDPSSKFDLALPEVDPFSEHYPSLKDGFYVFVAEEFSSDSFILWTSDATTQGTKEIRSFRTFDYSSTDFRVQHKLVDGDLFFLATDYNSTTGVETKGLWMSDGTQEGTRIIKQASDSYNFQWIDSPGDRLFFAVANPDNYEQMQLWITDGTDSGTALLKTFAKNFSGGTDHISVVWGLYDHWSNEEPPLFFLADDGVHGRELWQTDGTVSGTTLFKNLTPVDEAGEERGTQNVQVFRSWPDHPDEVMGNDIFILARKENGGSECTLWYTDGTISGTNMLKDLNIYSVSATGDTIEHIVNEGVLYFAIDDNQHGKELWVSDGTADGTRLVKDIKEGSEGSNIHLLYRPVRNAVYFNANGSELWRY
jgi:ELWxxDGT repeat protein